MILKVSIKKAKGDYRIIQAAHLLRMCGLCYNEPGKQADEKLMIN